MTTDAIGNKLLQELERAKTLMGTFKEDREDWLEVIERRRATQIQPELATLQRGIDYRTPDLEKAIGDLVDVLMMNPTLMDIHPMTSGEQAKKYARDINLWDARTWNDENDGRWWDAAVGEDQIKFGLAIMRLCYYEQREPDYEDIDQREKAMKANRKSPFYWKHVDPLACHFLVHDQDADAFYYEYEMAVLDANMQIKKKNGMRPTIDSAGKVYWLGAEEVPDRSTWDKKLTVVVKDARDPKNRLCPIEDCKFGRHLMRTITEYIVSEGDEPEEVETYDSPFPGCSFFIIPGRQSNSADMSRRYRPILYPLYSEAVWHNYLVTLLATLVREDYGDEDVYLDITKAPTNIELPEPGTDGRIVIAKAKKGEIQALPGELKRWPKEISPHLIELISQSQQRMLEYKPNRFITGSAYDETAEGTGTGITVATQQAALPFNRMLAQSDRAIQLGRKYKHHAIRYWATFSPSPQKYYAAMSGQEGIASGKVDAGDLIYVSDDKLAIDYEPVLKTESMTEAERAQAWMLAKDKHSMGAITDDELYQAAGQRDLETFKREKRKQQLRAEFEPNLAAWRSQYLARRFTVKTGISVTPMGGSGVPPEGMPAEGGPMGAATPQQLTGRAINPPPMASASGGASPLG